MLRQFPTAAAAADVHVFGRRTPMAAPLTRQVHVLDDRDISATLSRLHVGRLAFVRDGRIDIRPVHYVYSHGTIFGRTGNPSNLQGNAEGALPVVFEIDEVESLHRWKSILVRGELELLTAEGGDREEWRRAVDALRRLVRAALTDSDPTPERTAVFRIRIDEVSGRMMS
jgi:nitroimidazol reductase NimA-like FMN-containing flavoprotein (pyridoxamine 5'-phosphate oxidase superfamily)